MHFGLSDRIWRLISLKSGEMSVNIFLIARGRKQEGRDVKLSTSTHCFDVILMELRRALPRCSKMLGPDTFFPPVLLLSQLGDHDGVFDY